MNKQIADIINKFVAEHDEVLNQMTMDVQAGCAPSIECVAKLTRLTVSVINELSELIEEKEPEDEPCFYEDDYESNITDEDNLIDNS